MSAIQKKLSEARRVQSVQRNAAAGSGLELPPGSPGDDVASTVPVEAFDTLINSIFAPNNQRDCNTGLPVNVCMDKELPCLYEFTNACSQRRAEGDLVYGTTCLRHTNATNRTFTVMGSQTSVNMQPIALKTAVCEKNLFLWSFLTKVSYARAKELVSFMNVSTEESSNMAKFIMAVSEPRGARQNSEEYQRLTQYLAAYCVSAIKCIESVPERDKILVPINFSTVFMQNTQGNNLVNDIINSTELSVQEISPDVGQVFVPLKMLNILDQINILSFRMYCGVGRIALAPNCSITGDRIYLGTGLSIQNALSPVEITKLMSHYPDGIYRIIRNVHGDGVHNNYDILVMLAVPGNISTSISPQVFLAKRKFLTPTFDVDKLEILSFCI